MGSFDERSFELDIDFASLPPPTSADMSPDNALAQLWPKQPVDPTQPDVVLFDPMGFDLAAALRNYGYGVREAQSGVDVMTQVAGHPTGAVVCGPADDAEQRRLLTAALRLRFPQLPIIYASTHARNPGAVRGALAEGAHHVLPIPLPDVVELDGTLAQYVRRGAAPMPLALGTDPGADAGSDTGEVKTIALDRGIIDLDSLGPPPPTFGGRSDPGARRPTGEAATELHLPRARPGSPSDEARGFADVAGTSSELKAQRRRQFGDLLSAIAPFLWGLEDAARFVEIQAQDGDNEAANHARTLKLLATLLRQLKTRVDESGL